MTELNELRMAGYEVARRVGLVGGKKLMEVPFASEVVDDLVCRVMDDFFWFNTSEQFDPQGYELFRRAFLYLFGKGAEYAFFARLGYEIPRISYRFEEAMRGQGAKTLPGYVREQLKAKTAGVFTVYEAMVAEARSLQAEHGESGVDFPRCMYVVLSGAFFYGREYTLALKTREEDGNFAFEEEEDEGYDPDAYVPVEFAALP